MSHRLFQCLSPAKDDTEVSPPPIADSRPNHRSQQRRSRSVMSAFLSLFRSESPTAAAAAAGSAKSGPSSERRRRHHSTGSGRPPNSRMRLKRERCPKCHGVLPMKTPDLPPVLVRPGQARRQREFKEDSGCIMGEPRRAPADGRASGASASRASRPEDSGNFSMSSTANQAELLASLSRPAVFGLHGSKFSTVVPRIPNRDAPMSNCLEIRG